MDLMIANTNSKGQVVIPASVRKSLGISENTPLQIQIINGGVMFNPIAKVIKRGDFLDESLLQIIRETRGSWGPETPEEKKLNKLRRKKELKRTKQLKSAW